jgi:propionyl-CoA carboxylase beta chain
MPPRWSICQPNHSAFKAGHSYGICFASAPLAAEILYRNELGDPEKLAARAKEYQDRFANPFVAAERGYIDEVIRPRNTRGRIARALNMLRNKTVENPWKKHDNIPL